MSLATTKDALIAVLSTALAGEAGVQVSHGIPDPSSVPDVVAVLDSTSDADGEEQRFDHTLVVSCYVGGGNAAAPMALARAHAWLDLIHATIYGDPTLAGGCRVAVLDPTYRSVETLAYDAGGSNPVGRLAEITATVRTWSGRPLLGSLARPHDAP